MAAAAPPAAVRHPHLAEAPPAGWVRVDMHSHTMWSGDATTTPEELAAAVAEAAIDVLCITDHGTTVGAQRLAASGELGCRVIVGQELRCVSGEIIGLFLSERIPFGLSAPEACAAVRDQGGIVYIPHPYDALRRCLDEGTLEALVADGFVDAIEVFNAKVSLDSLNRRGAELAERAGLLAGAGSDAHEPSAIGAAYVEVPDFPDGDAAAFLGALRSARVRGHHYDAPRAWRPRVVPSTSPSSSPPSTPRNGAR